MTTAPAGRVVVGLGLVLVAGFVVLAIHCSRRHVRLQDSPLFVRWRTWVLIAPLWAAAVIWAPAALIVMAIVALVATREYAALADIRGPSRRTLMTAALVSVGLLAWDSTAWRLAAPLFVLAATVPPLARQDGDRGATTAALSLFGFLSISYLAGHVWLLRQMPSGGELVLALGLAVAMSDIGAFVVGSSLGGPALAPRLSPNKTRAGLAGNVAGAYLGFGVAATIAPPGLPAPAAWSLPAVIAVGCVWGDLLESMLKRQCGVKDAGDALPGFGGVLDRVDSLLVAAPVSYLFLTALGLVHA